jgi:predicted O-methyltransferase YrrM
VRTGSVVLVDNLLWGGRVAQLADASDESSTVALREFNLYFSTHPELQSEILSIGYGLGYAVKLKISRW